MNTKNKKALVIYYSLEGNTEIIAKKIAATVKSDILFLKPKKEMKSKGFMKFVWGGRQVMLKKEPELLPFEKNPEDYDILIIGTPVWMATFTPPLRSFFKSIDLKSKKAVLFCTHDGGPGKTIENMSKMLGDDANILSTMEFNRVAREKEINLKKCEEWINSIKF